MICCFIFFSNGSMKCYKSGNICKIAIFSSSNCCICGNIGKIATFVEISKKLVIVVLQVSNEFYIVKLELIMVL